MRAHPAAGDVAALERRSCAHAVLGRKAEHLIGAARAVATDDLPLAQFGDWPVARARHALLDQPGIGPWTSEYVLMRGIGLADCVLVGDAAWWRLCSVSTDCPRGRTRTRRGRCSRALHPTPVSRPSISGRV
jgi:3-methyladenine DNA glycosylase/8-oxoguanine DNA glycosylase